MCVYRSDCPGCCNQLRQASEPSVLTHTESIVSKVQIPLCKLWNTGGTWASDLLLTTQDRPHKHKQRTRQSTHAPGRDKTNTQREREYFCYSAFLSQRNSPSSFSIFISTSLTWSSQFLSVHNLRGRPGHTLLGLWTPEFFLTDQKVVAETLFRLLDKRGAAAASGCDELGICRWRSGQRSNVRWIFPLFFNISWELAAETEVRSSAICLQHVHIFQSRWFVVLWALF